MTRRTGDGLSQTAFRRGAHAIFSGIFLLGKCALTGARRSALMPKASPSVPTKIAWPPCSDR